MTSEFAGKRVLVTGADRGIGKAIALGFAREGAELRTSLYGGSKSACEADIRDEGDFESLVTEEGSSGSALR